MSLVNEFQEKITQRLAELEPLVDEYNELTDLLGRLRAEEGSSGRGGRRGGSGGRRADQALALVGERPGITVAELASEMEIGPTYLYKLLPSMERDGKVRKVGHGYEPAAGARA